eukprot:scpid91104/ scgid28964/ 
MEYQSRVPWIVVVCCKYAHCCSCAASHHWSSVETTGDVPVARAAHAACAHAGRMIIYGGMTTTGCLGDLCVLDLSKHHWSSVKTSGPAPSPRFDHTMCLVELQKDEQSERMAEGSAEMIDNASTREGSEACAVAATTDRDQQSLVTLLSAENSTASPMGPASLFPIPGQGRQIVLCILGGMDTMGTMKSEFLLLPLTE